MRTACLLALLAACSPPEAVGEVQTLDADRSEVYANGLLFASTDAAAERHDATLIDGEGEVRWRWGGEGQVLRVRRDGDDTLLLALDDADGVVGQVRRETLDGEVLAVIEAPEVHHDLLTLPDGRWAWIEHDNRRVPWDGLDSAPVSTDRVMVAEPGGTPEVLYAMFDDHPVDPWNVCSHTKKGARIPGHHQWTHSNSLVLDPSGDTLWLLARNLDALVGIDLATGAFAGQLGGRDATLPLDGDTALDHPHMSQMTGPGQFLVFDNGLHAKRASRAVELDTSTDPPRIVWEIAHPEGDTIGYLGDARRLPGGNTLVVWSSDARIMEYTPEGEVVWSMVVDDTKHIGRTELWSGSLP